MTTDQPSPPPYMEQFIEEGIDPDESFSLRLDYYTKAVAIGALVIVLAGFSYAFLIRPLIAWATN